MNKKQFVNATACYAIDLALEDLRLKEDATKRAKYYRKAGLELIAMAAEIDVERINGE